MNKYLGNGYHAHQRQVGNPLVSKPEVEGDAWLVVGAWVGVGLIVAVLLARAILL